MGGSAGSVRALTWGLGLSAAPPHPQGSQPHAAPVGPVGGLLPGGVPGSCDSAGHLLPELSPPGQQPDVQELQGLSQVNTSVPRLPSVTREK